MNLYSILAVGICIVTSQLQAIPCSSVNLGGKYSLQIKNGDVAKISFKACKNKPRIHLKNERNLQQSLPCFEIGGETAADIPYATLFEKNGFCFLVMENKNRIFPKQILKIEGLGNMSLGNDQIEDSLGDFFEEAYLTLIER